MAHIGDLLEISAQRAPRGAALKSAATDLTWRELLHAVRRLETALAVHSPEGGRVALLLSDPAETLIAFFACARSGRIAMVMDRSWPKARVQDLLVATQPALCLDDDQYRMLASSSLTDSGTDRAPLPSESSDFYGGFTSGSTGLPKGFVRSHGSWLESFRLSDVDFAVAHPKRIVIPGGVSHSLHLYGAVHGLHRGTPVILLPRFDPRTVLEELQLEEGRAALYATPTQLQMIAGAARRKGPLKCVPVVFCSGAKWPDGARAAVAGVFPAAHLVEFYGASETSFISFRRSGEDTPPGSVGRLADGVRVAIGDPQERLPAGMAGPVWVKSRLLFSGYICGHAPETVWRDGWLSIGDHGFLDDSGNLFLTGRQNRMVITSGLNVYPEEIEAVLTAHPAVGLAAVVGLDDPLRGARLEAVVELNCNLEDPERTLAGHCRDQIGSAKTPRRFHVRANLPLTAGGKPDLQLIRADLDKADGARLPESQIP